MLRRVLGVSAVVAGAVMLAVALFFLLTVVYHVYVDREGLPDIGPFGSHDSPEAARHHQVLRAGPRPLTTRVAIMSAPLRP